MMETARYFAIELVDPNFETSTADFDKMGGLFPQARELRLRKITRAEERIAERDAAIRKECADRAVTCFFTAMAESGLSIGNEYAVLVISDKLRAAIMGDRNTTS